MKKNKTSVSASEDRTYDIDQPAQDPLVEQGEDNSVKVAQQLATIVAVDSDSTIPSADSATLTHSQPIEQQIVYKNIDTLTFNPRNANKMSTTIFQRLKRSIRTHGFIVPILLDAQDMIIDGNHRVKALQEIIAEDALPPSHPIHGIPTILVPSSTLNDSLLLSILINEVKGYIDIDIYTDELEIIVEEETIQQVASTLALSPEELQAILDSSSLENDIPDDNEPASSPNEPSPDNLTTINIKCTANEKEQIMEYVANKTNTQNPVSKHLKQLLLNLSSHNIPNTTNDKTVTNIPH